MNIYPASHLDNNSTHKVILFIHGGAWNSGDKFLYHNVGLNLQKHLPNCTTIVCNYTLSPEGFIEDQVEDICNCVEWIHKDLIKFMKENSSLFDNIKNIELTVCGHSAGGHLTFLSCLFSPKTLQKITNIISFASVFDIVNQYERELERCVENISGLRKVMHGEENLVKYSPYQLLKSGNYDFFFKTKANIYLLQGKKDFTIPKIQIETFTQLLKDKGMNVFHEMLDDVDHSLVVKSLMNIDTRKEINKTIINIFSKVILQ
ncbi:hypothetical protein ABK040_000149 [Willaertia magna]